MKKGICILAVFLISGAATLYGKKIKQIISEKPENKTISFSIFAGTDYSSSLYKKSRAKVILTVCKFNGDNQEVVWQGVINDRGVKNYPSSVDPLYREVCIYNVFDRYEKLAAYYQVIYDSKGSKLSYVQGIPLAAGSQKDSLKISI
jgi:hypothetical protein